MSYLHGKSVFKKQWESHSHTEINHFLLKYQNAAFAGWNINKNQWNLTHLRRVLSLQSSHLNKLTLSVPLVPKLESFPSNIQFQQEMHHIKCFCYWICNENIEEHAVCVCRIHPSIHHVKLYLSGLGQYSHSHGAGVYPALFFSLGNPLNSMDSSLKLHPLVALRAADAGRGVT